MVKMRLFARVLFLEGYHGLANEATESLERLVAALGDPEAAEEEAEVKDGMGADANAEVKAKVNDSKGEDAKAERKEEEG